MKEFFTHILPTNKIIDDEFLCTAYACDASPYYLVPKLVLLVDNSIEVQQVIKIASQNQLDLIKLA